MIEIGRLCVKIAGRDSGCKCIIVDILDCNYVLVDGETRRKKCNVAHLEPLDQVVKISKGASHEDVKKELDKIGLKIRETKPKDKKERPKRIRKKKEAEEEKPKKVKKEKKKTADKKSEEVKKKEEPVQKQSDEKK